MDSHLERRFDAAMMALYDAARKEAKYNAGYYHQMLLERGGIETARMLVLSDQPSSGYTAMWECGRLDLTVEALILRPEWSQLFAEEPEVTRKARQRLSEYGYEPGNTP